MRSSTALLTALMTIAAQPGFGQDASKVADDLAQKWMSNYDSGNAAGNAAMFTTDALFSPAATVTLKGHEAIEKGIAGRMKAGWTKEAINVTDAHPIGNAIWEFGDYTLIGSGEVEGKKISGKFGGVIVRDGNDWRFALIMGNGAPSK